MDSAHAQYFANTLATVTESTYILALQMSETDAKRRKAKLTKPCLATRGRARVRNVDESINKARGEYRNPCETTFSASLRRGFTGHTELSYVEISRVW